MYEVKPSPVINSLPCSVEPIIENMPLVSPRNQTCRSSLINIVKGVVGGDKDVQQPRKEQAEWRDSGRSERESVKERGREEVRWEKRGVRRQKCKMDTKGSL